MISPDFGTIIIFVKIHGNAGKISLLELLKVIFLDFAVQGSFADSEDFSGFFAVSFCFGECLLDCFSFQLVYYHFACTPVLIERTDEHPTDICIIQGA